MRTRLVKILPAILALLVMALIVLLQLHFDRPGFERLKKADKIKYELIDTGVHLLPSPAALKVISGGFDAILAEFIMIKTYNYLYQYHYKGRDRGYMRRLYSGVTALDPYYFSAYRYGGYFLPGPFKMQTDALRSYKTGVIALGRPDFKLSDSWEVPENVIAERPEFDPRERAVKLMYETGIHYFSYLKDQPRAIQVFQAAQGTFPEYKNDFFETEVGLRSELRQYELVVERWERFIDANRSDPRKIAMAEAQIKRYGTLFQIERLEKRLKNIASAGKPNPAYLPDFAHPAEGLDRYGMVLMYEAGHGRLLSRELVTEDVKMVRSGLQSAVRRYDKKVGMYPPDLEAQVKKAVLQKEIPYAMQFPYDPQTGAVGLPMGFGDDIGRLLYEIQAAFYHYAAANNAWPAPAVRDPMDIVLATGDLKNIAALTQLHQSLDRPELRTLPGGPHFGLAARSTDGRIFILGSSGPMYARQGTAFPDAWPADLSDWELISP